MKNVTYTTLAAARSQHAAEFDAAVERAVRTAADKVGKNAFVRAVVAPSEAAKKLERKAA